jgi:PKD repeat protein
MKRKKAGFLWFMAVLVLSGGFAPDVSADINPDPPVLPVKLIFIHHSTGEGWLADYDGGLGIALRDNNYFVSDTNYGWGPDGIGDLTDIGHWWEWFRGPNRSTYMNALFSENRRNSDYSRLRQNPGGPNEIIMFKSCFPNSQLEGRPDDPPPSHNNPLRGRDCSSRHHTIANAKGIYNDLLSYFATRQDKLFIVVTAPPLTANGTDTSAATNARALNDWLVNDWLEDYAFLNVAVFDFYNVLTSNGGNRNANDAGSPTGNHHRVWNSAVQHLRTVDQNTSAYGLDAWDSHPTTAGNKKATREFVRLLNVYYHAWRGSGDDPRPDLHNTPPVIDLFTADMTSGTIPLTVHFECEAHDPDGVVSEFRWDFDGDGRIDTPTAQGIAEFTYQTTGIFPASCTVLDDSGAAVSSQPIAITVTRAKRGNIRK